MAFHFCILTSLWIFELWSEFLVRLCVPLFVLSPFQLPKFSDFRPKTVLKFWSHLIRYGHSNDPASLLPNCCSSEISHGWGTVAIPQTERKRGLIWIVPFTDAVHGRLAPKQTPHGRQMCERKVLSLRLLRWTGTQCHGGREEGPRTQDYAFTSHPDTQKCDLVIPSATWKSIWQNQT